jgi:hypothetical protein
MKKYKYQKLLTIAEAGYHCNDNGLFLKYFNGFLNEFELEMPLDNSFENCINYLNSISFIMVEKFLCSYFLYIENNGIQYSMPDSFDQYDVEELKRLENRSPIMRLMIDQTGKDILYQKVLSIKINSDGILYLNNSLDFSIFDIFKKTENNPRYFINTKDFIAIYNRLKKPMNNKDIKDFQSFCKSVIGKPITEYYKPTIIKI